jgi:hypothetical protein
MARGKRRKRARVPDDPEVRRVLMVRLVRVLFRARQHLGHKLAAEYYARNPQPRWEPNRPPWADWTWVVGGVRHYSTRYGPPPPGVYGAPPEPAAVQPPVSDSLPEVTTKTSRWVRPVAEHQKWFVVPLIFFIGAVVTGLASETWHSLHVQLFILSLALLCCSVGWFVFSILVVRWTKFVAAAVLAAGWAALSFSAFNTETPTGVLSLECSPDMRTGEHSSMDGELPKEALFLEPDGRSVQIAIANEPSRDANGYLYEIRQFFIRCDLRNVVTSADAAKATVTFQGWFIVRPNAVATGEILNALDPGLMARQRAPDISAAIEAPALGRAPFEFAIVNRAPHPVYLSNLPTARIVRPDLSSHDATVTQSKMSQWAFLNIFPPAELKHKRVRHFSRCHYRTYETSVERKHVPQYVPRECQPDAMKREMQQWRADDERNHVIDD